MKLSNEEKKQIIRSQNLNNNHNKWAMYEGDTLAYTQELLSGDVPFFEPGDDIFARKDIVL